MPRKKYKPSGKGEEGARRKSFGRLSKDSYGRTPGQTGDHGSTRRSNNRYPQESRRSWSERPEEESCWLYGIQPVLEALRKKERTVEKIWLAYGRSGGAIRQILALAREQKIPVSSLDRNKLEQKARTAKHQGILALVAQVPRIDLDAFLESPPRGEYRFFALVDGVQDPGNLGAILRTACAAGMDGVLLPERRVCPITPAVMKASAGAGQWLPLVRTGNASRATEQIHDKGILLLGADPAAETQIYEVDLCRDLCFVIGGEGKGLRPGLKKFCDQRVSIPMRGSLGSLNVSVASAVLFYEAVRQRDEKARNP